MKDSRDCKLLTMLLLSSGAAFAGDRENPSSVPPRASRARMCATLTWRLATCLEWPYVR